MNSLRRHAVVARQADLHLLRRDLCDWALAAGLIVDQAEDLTLACYEVLTNIAEHAYPTDLDGTFDVEAMVTTTRIDVVIRDRGTWKIPDQDTSSTSMRGRGLRLARAVSDHMTVETGPHGTTVLLRWNLPVPGPTLQAPL